MGRGGRGQLQSPEFNVLSKVKRGHLRTTATPTRKWMREEGRTRGEGGGDGGRRRRGGGQRETLQCRLNIIGSGQ